MTDNDFGEGSEMLGFSCDTGDVTEKFCARGRHKPLTEEEGRTLWSRLKEKGYCPLPADEGEKFNRNRAWPLRAAEGRFSWTSLQPGISLLCGSAVPDDENAEHPYRSVVMKGGLLALDFDLNKSVRGEPPTLSIEEQLRVREAISSLPAFKKIAHLLRERVGAANFLIPMQNSGDVKNGVFSFYKQGKLAVAIEVLASGRQFAAFALHPTGKPYLWDRCWSPENTPLDALPPISSAELQELHRQIAKALSPLGLVDTSTCASQLDARGISRRAAGTSCHTPPSPDDMRRALAYLAARGCFGFRKGVIKDGTGRIAKIGWIETGMALKLAYGEEVGFDLWSVTHIDEVAIADAPEQWASFATEAHCGHIQIGTIIKAALDAGFKFSPEHEHETVLAASEDEDDTFSDIPGGFYEADDLFERIDKRFALVNNNGSLVFVRRTKRGHEIITKESAQLLLQNTRVKGNGKGRDRTGLEIWLAHPRRVCKRPVFKPTGDVAPDEYNFWVGFGISRQPGRTKIKRLLKHIWKFLCGRNRAKFRYLVRWLAWAVQNPDKNPETSVVLKSHGEGTGKSTLNSVMCRVFGEAHSAVIASPNDLLGTHADYLEYACFVACEEALFAGDPRIADQIKERITGNKLLINPKFMKAWWCPNRMHAILATNHDWAVPAGRNARRWFVLEVDEGATFDREWFSALNADLETGGYEQFLDFLLSLRLEDWHPRQLHRTRELAEQQVLSAGSVLQWLLACVEFDGIPDEQGLRSLNHEYLTHDLYKSYCHHAKQGRERVADHITFGKKLTSTLKEENRRKNVGVNRGRGYFIPSGEELERLVMAEIGIALVQRPRL